jgi:hypothetical protein
MVKGPAGTKIIIIPSFSRIRGGVTGSVGIAAGAQDAKEKEATKRMMESLFISTLLQVFSCGLTLFKSPFIQAWINPMTR